MWIILIVALFATVIVGPALGLTLKDLYPFGDQAGDEAMSKNDDGSSPQIPISTLFPFFNHQHSKLFVSRTFYVCMFYKNIKTLNLYRPQFVDGRHLNNDTIFE